MPAATGLLRDRAADLKEDPVLALHLDLFVIQTARDTSCERSATSLRAEIGFSCCFRAACLAAKRI